MRALLLDRRAQPIKNLAPVPRPVSGQSTIWVSRWFGSGGNGTSGLSTVNAVNGRAFIRKTWTVAPISPEDTAVTVRNLPVTPGKRYTMTVRVRSSIAQRMRGFADASISVRGAASLGGTYQAVASTSTSGFVNLLPGLWTTLKTSFVVPDGVFVLEAFPYVNGVAQGATNWAVGDTFDMGDMMLVEGVYDGVYCDGDTPGWRWTGAAGVSESVGWPYTLASVAGAPRWDAEFPALGTDLPGTFNEHTSFGYGDILTSGQKGWLASLPDASGKRWESLNISTTARGPYVRVQNATPSGGIGTGGTPSPANEIVASYWGADGGIGVRSYAVSTVENFNNPVAGRAPTPGYRLRSGVRDQGTASGVSLARQIVYDRVLTAAESLAVARWLANRYGTALTA